MKLSLRIVAVLAMVLAIVVCLVEDYRHDMKKLQATAESSQVATPTPVVYDIKELAPGQLYAVVPRPEVRPRLISGQDDPLVTSALAGLTKKLGRPVTWEFCKVVTSQYNGQPTQWLEVKIPPTATS